MFDQERERLLITVTVVSDMPILLFFDNDYDQPKGTHALMIKDKTNDEVCYFISFRNVELLCLQDLIKVEAHERPIRVTGTNTEQRSKTGLHYMTATTIESNWIALLV